MFYPSYSQFLALDEGGSARARAKTDYDCTRKRNTTNEPRLPTMPVSCTDKAATMGRAVSALRGLIRWVLTLNCCTAIA